MAPSSFLINFNLAGKTVNTLALVMANLYSDLAVLHIGNQHLFLQHLAAIFVPAAGHKTD